MKSTDKNFRTWNDFLNFRGSHSERIQKLKQVLLDLGSPTSLRQLIWVSIVDPDFAGNCLKFFRITPSTSPLPHLTRKHIDKALQTPFPSILKPYFNDKSIRTLLTSFALKRPDIGFSFGMQYIAAILSSAFIVESDIFIMFCHIYENLYPTVLIIQDFFSPKNRNMGLHQELRIFALMSEHMRPKLVNCLKAVYNTSSKPETDSSPFVTLMKNIADVWFKTLFTTVLPYKNLLRFFDVFLVFGAEFLHKFSLAYLCKKESFVINSIKSETKGLNLGASVEALIISGNITKAKLLGKTENFDIESMLKKCLKKASYRALNRFDYLTNAVVLESKSSERLTRMKKCKSLLEDKPLLAAEATLIINSFNSEQITRTAFIQLIQQICSWNALTSNTIFSTFDQKGEDIIDTSSLSIGISLLVTGGTNEKLELCFHVFDTDRSGYLSSSELSEMIIKIESALDGRSSFYQRESENMMKLLDSNKDSKISLEEFIQTVTTHKLFKPILEFIQLVIPDDDLVKAAAESEYEDIHSPLLATESNESASESLVEQNVLEAEIEYKVPEFAKESGGDTESEGKEGEEEEEEGSGRVDEEFKGSVEQTKGVEGVKGGNIGKKFEGEKVYEEVEVVKDEVGRAGNQEFRELEHSISMEYHVDFPEARNKDKDRECARLCTKQTCGII